MDLPSAVLACIDLEAAAAGLALRAPLSRYVVSLQAFEPPLAPAHQARSRERRVETAGRSYGLAACAPSAKLGGTGNAGRQSRTSRLCGSLTICPFRSGSFRAPKISTMKILKNSLNIS